MPNNMDERVVSMQFDNKKFERNVKHSMKTIDDLKESLDFDKSAQSLDELDKGFKKFNKNNHFGEVDKAVSGLQKSMAILGDSTSSLFRKFAEATKITAIFEAAEGAVRSLERSIKQFTIAPISEGFDKYTTKIASIKTISNATGMAAEAVNDELERLNWFTDETSASFGEMVNNIGKFTSVGRGLSESITAMQGIATWGYQSGAGVQEINRAMYNLSQALGTGSVKLMDWKSIENAGMATKEFKEQAIQAAEAAGTLVRKSDKLFTKKGNKQVTTANFNETLAQGWFSSDVLMKTLDVYGGYAAELKDYMEKHPQYNLAAEAMEAMDAEREAKQLQIYSDNMDAWTKKSGKNATKIKDQITEINKIASVKEREKEIAKFAKEVGIDAKQATKILDELAATEESLGEKAFKSSQQAKSFQEAIDATKDAVSTQWMNTFQHIFGGLEDSIKVWSDITEIFWELFAAGGDARNNAFIHWAEEFGGRDDLWGEDGVLHTIMDTIIELKNLLSTSFKDVFFPDLGSKISRLIGQEERLEAVQNGLFTDDQIRWAREGSYMGRQIKNITGSIKQFGKSFKEFFTNPQNMAKIQQIFTTVATIAKFVGDTNGKVFKTIGNVVKKTGVFQDILSVASKIGEKVQSVIDKINKSGFVTNVLTKIGDTLTWFYDRLKTWYGQISEFLEESGIGPAIRNFFGEIEKFFLGGEEDVDENGEKTESAFFRAFAWTKDVKEWIDNINMKDALNNVKDFFVNFGTLWGAFTSALNGEEVDTDKLVKDGLPETLKGVADTFKDFGGKLSGVFSFFKEIWDKVTGFLEESGVLPWIRSTWENIKTFFENIALVWDVFVNGKAVNPKDLNEKQYNLITGIGGFFKKLQNLWEKIKGWFNTAVSWVSEKWGQFTGWLESSGILPTLRDWWGKILGFFGLGGEQEELFEIEDYATPLAGFAEKVNEVVDGDGKTNKKSGLLSKLQGFVEGVKKLWAKAKEIFKKVVDWVVDKWTKFTTWLETSGILPKIREIWQKIKDFFSSISVIWDLLFHGGANVDATKLTSGQLDIITKVMGFFNNLKSKWDKFKNWLETSGILPTLRDWWSKITTWFENVKKDITENGVFKTVGDFFTNLWSTVTGWFGGGETVELPGVEAPEVKQGEQKGGIFSGMLANIKEAFTKDGKLDLSKGFSTSIAKGLEFITDTIGGINWESFFGMFSNAFVGAVNSFDDALGKMHYQNILKVVKDVLWAFQSIMWAKAAASLFGTIKSFVTKGKDKGLLEKFTELLSALGDALLKIGITIALIAGSMWLISSIYDPNNTKKFEAAQSVLIGIGIFLAGFVVIVALLVALIPDATSGGNRLANAFTSIGSMFLMIGSAIVLIVAAIWLMSKMIDKEGKISDNLKTTLFVIAGIVGVMLLVIVAIAAITRGIGVANVAVSIATFTGMAILIATLAGCIILLQGIDDIGKAWSNAAVLGALLMLIGVAMKIMNNIKVEGKTIAMMAVLAVVIGILAAALYVLKDGKWDSMLGAAGAIAILLAALVGAALVMDKIKPGALKGAAILMGIIAIIVAGLAAMAVIVSGAAETIINRLVSIMSSLAAAGVSASIVDGDAILEAIGLLDEIVAAFARTTGMGINTATALKVVADTWDVLNQLSIATDAAENVDVKEFYKIFGEDGNGGLLQVIQTGMASVTDTGFKAATLGRRVEQLAESLKLVGQAGLILNKELDDYGKQTYSQGIENVKNQLTDIQEIVEMATTMGTVGEGEDIRQINLTTFSEGIANIGAALQLYNTALADFEKEAGVTEGVEEPDIPTISTGAISKALENVMSALKDVTYDDSKIGEVAKWAGLDKSGEDGGTLFALGLTNIANSMGIFSNAAKDFDNENVDKAIKSLETLAAIKDQVENPAQYQDTVNDIKSWGDAGDPDSNGSFANAISSMGTAMAAFGQSVKDIPNDSVTNATTALKTLAAIYKRLRKNEGMLSFFSIETLLGKISFGNETKSSEQVFTEFGEGIGKLGSALNTFSKSIGKETYNPENVSAAVQILKDMAKMEKALKKANLGQDWWYTVWFGESNLKTFGENLAGLGSRLAVFAQELNGNDEVDAFDLDIESDRWKNVSGVMSFLVEMAGDLNEMSANIEKYDPDTGMMTEQVINSGIQLQELGTGIANLTGNLKTFNAAMQEIYSVQNGTATYQLGDWDADRWGNIKSLLGDIKQLAIDFRDAKLTQADIDMIGKFGDSVGDMFGRLNNQESFTGGIGNNRISNLADFMAKFDSADGINTSAFTTFVTNMKSIADAAALLHNQGVDYSDIENLSLLIEEVLGQSFQMSGIGIGSMFIKGFIDSITNTEAVEGVVTISTAFENLLLIIDGYSEAFKTKGKSAGEQFAQGFNEGLSTIDDSKLTPVVNMDSNGKVTGGTGFVGVLAKMNYATASDISELITRLDNIQVKFDKSINVKDDHTGEILNGVTTANKHLEDLSKLDSIKKKVEEIDEDISNLKLYIDKKTLVASIVNDMDSALGDLAAHR